MLAVMPLGLLENWLEELATTLGTRTGPFEDVVVLQGLGLTDYRLRGATRETAARVEDLDEHGSREATGAGAGVRRRLSGQAASGQGWPSRRSIAPTGLVQCPRTSPPIPRYGPVCPDW